MRTPLQPENEAQRLEALRQYDLLDSLPESALDDLTALAAGLCGVPMAHISLVEEGRQRFKSKVGISLGEIPRDISFCGHAILQPDLLIVPDTLRDERFADNPMVTGEPGIRFYAGAPLLTPGGEALGALCVMDRVPRELSITQLESLRVLGRQVMSQLELRKQRQALLGSEQLYRAMVGTLPDIIFTNRNGRIDFINSPGLRLLRAEDATRIVGRDALDFFHPDCREVVREWFARLLTGTATAPWLEERMLALDGTEIQVEISATSFELQGEPLIQVVCREIGDRKQAERNSHLLSAIVESSDDAIIGKDLGGIITSWNRGAEKIFGYTAREIIGASILRLIPEDRQDEEIQILGKIRAGESIEHFETLRRTKDGRRIHVSITVSPIRTADGKVVGVSKIARDITGQKQTEAELLSRDADLQLVLDAAKLGRWNWNIATGELDWSPQCLALYGLPDGTPMTYDKFLGLLHLEDRGRVAAALRRSVDEGTRYDEEKRVIWPDGSVHWTVSRGQVYYAPDGTPQRMTGVTFDITERKRMMAQALRAQRMDSIGTLAGGIAHDLNNVLAPILMSIETLRDIIKNEEDASVLATLETGVLRASELVKQVLSFARGVEGQRIPVNPRHLMLDLMKVMHDTFPKSIEVRFNKPAELWTVTGDPTQLHQVLLNLCVNARDAMPQGGMLTIVMENVVLDETYAAMNPDSRPGSYVKIKVIDTGTGIPPQIRDRVFEPFFTTKETGQGTGLGLSTTMAIVKSHGGFIHLYSEVGRGTKFKVYLPAVTTAGAASEVALQRTELPRGCGQVVLVVDDEAGIRKIAQRTLERFGYRVLLATQGAEAVALYAQHRDEIAVVLTDMAMPIMDGPALIIALKSMNPEVKIIGSSGHAANEGVAKVMGAGVEHFVPKPYTAETILKVLAEVLNPLKRP